MDRFHPAHDTVLTEPVQPAAVPPTTSTPRHALTFCQLAETAVELSGNDLSGEVFVDEYTTLAIAHDGLILRMRRALAPDQEVFVRYRNREVIARVMSYSRDGTYSLSFDAPEPGFWSGIIEGNDGIPLTAPEPTIAPDPLLVPQDEQFEPSPPPKPPERHVERRRSARITMRQAKACIEGPDRTPEVAELINISRGGVCFRSHRVYPLHCQIRVAAPYTDGSTNVFVPARIVRVHRDSWGGVYGAEYTR